MRNAIRGTAVEWSMVRRRKPEVEMAVEKQEGEAQGREDGGTTARRNMYVTDHLKPELCTEQDVPVSRPWSKSKNIGNADTFLFGTASMDKALVTTTCRTATRKNTLGQ